MSNNIVTVDFFAVLLKDLIMAQDDPEFKLKKHMDEFKNSWDKEHDIPESVQYFVQYMTTSDDAEQIEHHHALQEYLLQEISKSENKELQIAIKNYSEDMIGQYFQRMENLRMEKGFNNILEMYDASRNQANNGNIRNEMIELTNGVINDFTAAEQQQQENEVAPRLGIGQVIARFFVELIARFRGQNQVHQQQGEKIKQDIIDPQDAFNAIKKELQNMQQQGEFNLQERQQEQSISQEIIHDAALILENCQEVFTGIVEHKGEVRQTIVEGERKTRQTSVSLG